MKFYPFKWKAGNVECVGVIPHLDIKKEALLWGYDVLGTELDAMLDKHVYCDHYGISNKEFSYRLFHDELHPKLCNYRYGATFLHINGEIVPIIVKTYKETPNEPELLNFLGKGFTPMERLDCFLWILYKILGRKDRQHNLQYIYGIAERKDKGYSFEDELEACDIRFHFDELPPLPSNSALRDLRKRFVTYFENIIQGKYKPNKNKRYWRHKLEKEYDCNEYTGHIELISTDEYNKIMNSSYKNSSPIRIHWF